jgi:hypothetical protein
MSVIVMDQSNNQGSIASGMVEGLRGAVLPKWSAGIELKVHLLARSLSQLSHTPPLSLNTLPFLPADIIATLVITARDDTLPAEENECSSLPSPMMTTTTM